jgi:hypothetical protein
MSFASVEDLAAYLQRDLTELTDIADLALELVSAAIQAEAGQLLAGPPRPYRRPHRDHRAAAGAAGDRGQDHCGGRCQPDRQRLHRQRPGVLRTGPLGAARSPSPPPWLRRHVIRPADACLFIGMPSCS